MSPLTLDAATRIADAALDLATGRGMANLSVVVTDAGGNIRAALRSDGHGPFPLQVAHAKARSALGFNRSTLQLAGFFAQNPSSIMGIGGAAGGFVPIGGGVVIADDDGAIVGAAAAAGGLPENDDAVIRDAVAGAGLRSLD